MLINSNEKNKAVQHKKILEDKHCKVLCRLVFASAFIIYFIMQQI